MYPYIFLRQDSIYTLELLINFPCPGLGGLVRLRLLTLTYHVRAAIPAISATPPKNPPTVPPTSTALDTDPLSVSVDTGGLVSVGNVKANVATLILQKLDRFILGFT